MYAILGSVRFEGYKGFSGFSATNETVLAEHPVIEGKPRLQIVGEKLEEISISFLLHSQFCNPESELEILQGYRRAGEVLPFITGDGYNYGNFVIKSIGRTMEQTNNNGAIIAILVDVTLLEAFVPGQTKKTSERLATKLPNLSVRPLASRLTDPQAISVNLRTINVQSAKMNAELSEASRVTSKGARALRKAKERTEKIAASLKEIERVGTATRDIIGMYDNMKGQVFAVSTQVEALSVFVQNADINSAVNASAQLRNSYNKLSIDAAPVNNLVSLRRDKESPLTEGGTRFDFRFNGRF